MSQFTIVDFASQAGAIARYTKGWKRNDLLDWLRQFGEVTELDMYPGVNDLFHFSTPAGLWVTFRYTDDGQLIIFGDHTCWVVEAE